MKKASRLETYVEKRWYGRPGLLLLLSPLEWVFSSISQRRKRRLQASAYKSAVPLVVVGNISVGGTGKTPTIISLVKYLQARGMTPGIVSRGYGRINKSQLLVTGNSVYQDVGDEPMVIYAATRCSIAVGLDRTKCIETLISQGCDLVLADDGLQHYEMARDKEIIVIDGERLFGNGHLLPVGPLRESPIRLDEADWVLINMQEGKDAAPLLSSIPSAYIMSVQPSGITRISSGEQYRLDFLSTLGVVAAVVGLGNPNKFFHSLDVLGVKYEKYIFPDHHQYTLEDFISIGNRTILMTEKDAVKCKDYVGSNAFFLNIEMQLPHVFLEEFYQTINIGHCQL